MGIKARWVGLEDVLGKIHVMPEKLSKAIKEIIDRNDRLLETHIKQDLMQGGTNDTQLAGRTGQLASSTRAINATIEDGAARVSGGINFGQKYARVHIGPKGQITTIRPVNRQWLTIPLEATKHLMRVNSTQAKYSRRQENQSPLKHIVSNMIRWVLTQFRVKVR